MRLSSVPSIKSALTKWINPEIGQLPLTKVHSGSVKHLVTKMRDGGLTPKTIDTYTNIIKAVVASVIDEESGEPVLPRKWNSTVLDLPIIEDQKQPCFSREEIEGLLSFTGGWEKMLYLILASSGLRISEALALETSHIANEGRTLIICQQVNRFGRIVKLTKTKAGIRQVDLHPDVAAKIMAFTKDKSGLLLPTKEGTPRLYGNVQRRRLSKHTKKGWHSFRRYRNTHLRSPKINCQQDMLIYWMGHKPESMTELYSKLREMPDERLAEAERVGTGFDVNTRTTFMRRDGGHKLLPVARPFEELRELAHREVAALLTK